MTRVYDSLGGAAAVYAFQSSAQTRPARSFLQGKVALKIDGYWTLPRGARPVRRNLNYGVAAPPLPAKAVAAGRPRMSWVSGWCYAIPSTARNKEGGWELLKYLSSQRAAEVMGEANRLQLGSQGLVYVPNQSANRKINQWLYQKYVAGNPAIPEKVRDGVQLLNDLIDNSPIRPVTPVGQLLFNEQKRATENAIFHKLSPQAALDEANQTVQRQLDRALQPAARSARAVEIFHRGLPGASSRLRADLFTGGKPARRAEARQLKARAAVIFGRNGAAAGFALRPGSSGSSC